MSDSQGQPESPAMPTSNGIVTFPIERGSQVAVLSVSITFIILPTLAVFLRCLARRISRRRLEPSDYCIIVACVFVNIYQAVAIVGVVQSGVGFHFEEIVAMYGPEPFVKFMKLMIPIQILWAISLSFCKISILLLYTRIFTMRLMIVVAWATAALITGFALSTVLSCLLICRPLALNWDPTLEGTCGDQLLSYTITGSFNLATDVIVLLLPLPYLWKLQMKLYKKIILSCTFSLGICTVVISGMRLAAIPDVDYLDLTYSVPKTLILSSLEPSLGVTLACIPLLRPLLGRSKYSENGTASHEISAQAPGGSGAIRSRDEIRKKDGFAVLDDDSSQYQLRPVAGQHNTAVSAARVDGSPGSSDAEDGDVRRSRGPTVDKGIAVERTWLVSTSSS